MQRQAIVSIKRSEVISRDRAASVPRFPGVIGTFMGRDALSLAASYLRLGPNDQVLLPVYTCHEVIRAFTARTQVAFYDVEPDLTISPDEVQAKIQGRRIKALLITNYFGFLQPHRREIKRICEEQDIRLVEDCAHSLLTKGSGESGDLVIYSFRKILPLRDGGGLKVNRAGDTPTPTFLPQRYSNALSLLALAKKSLNLHSNRFSRAQVGTRTSNLVGGKSSGAINRTLSLSSFARDKMSKIPFDEVMRRRREDFQFWLDFSKDGARMTPAYSYLPQGVCPFGFPVKIEARAAVEAKCRKAGLALGVHWRLDPSLAMDCCSSHALSAGLLTLPLYPELNEEGRDTLVKILAA